MQHVLFFLSGLAYACSVLILAGLHRRIVPDAAPSAQTAAAERENAVPRRVLPYAAGCFALAAFFAVPPGSVPPLCDAPWGGAAFFGCLLLSFSRGADRRACIGGLCRIGIIFATLAFYSHERGIPGSTFNFGTYAALPLWEPAGWAGKAALGLLCCGLILELAGLPQRERHVQRLALACLPIVFFAPWTLAGLVQSAGPAILIVDFFLFWGKVLFGAWAVRAARPQLLRVPVPWVFLFAGALLLAVDFW